MAAPGLELLYELPSPGLELLYELAAPRITEPQEPLICFIHWELIGRGLRCLGTGDKAGAQETGTERLPNEWADNKELYTLRYGHGVSQILLKALTVDGTLIVNAMDLQTEKVSNVTLNIEDFIDRAHLQQYQREFQERLQFDPKVVVQVAKVIKKTGPPFKGAWDAASVVYKKRSELKQCLDAKLFSPLLDPKKKETSKAEKVREKRSVDDDPLRVPTRAPASHHPSWVDPPGYIPYGAADLDPLGGSSGGMIMDPFNAGRTRPRPNPLGGLPPGAVPPGARFDPFGPIPPGRAGPDPDHLPPPGYDDMFM